MKYVILKNDSEISFSPSANSFHSGNLYISADRDIWLLKPKDLLAAISVNRHFHATLTPLLWSVYVQSAVKSPGDYDLIHYIGYHDIPFVIVQKNSSYTRFLDLSRYFSRFDRKVEQLELNCSRLQELRLSASVDCAWAQRLILANSELHVLHWARTSKKFTRELTPRGAQPDPLQLHCPQTFTTRCHGQVTNIFSKVDRGGEEFESMKRICGRIRLVKLKTFHLDVEHNFCSLTFYWMFDVVPALETVVFEELLGSTAKALSLTLRKSCPRLQTIKLGHIWEVNSWRPHQHSDAALYLTSACAPGHLVHASLDGWCIDDTFMEALSVHRDSLETLELAIRGEDYRDSFNNLGAILERCSRLKYLAVSFHERPRVRPQLLLFMNKLASCPGLESLAFRGFRLEDENNHSRVKIDWNESFEDYEPEDYEPYIAYWPYWQDVEGVITIVEQYLKSGRAEVSSAAVMLMDGVIDLETPQEYDWKTRQGFFLGDSKMDPHRAD
ncbi:MAG: hypothetical protein JOS17DRAFT_791358 [Linnemannia elongata]|nr:MAG: hypothetical protein JOS17DRAFT_791358 [Linnemannia elongata]